MSYLNIKDNKNNRFSLVNFVVIYKHYHIFMLYMNMHNYIMFILHFRCGLYETWMVRKEALLPVAGLFDLNHLI